MFSLSSFGRDHLSCVSGVASVRRVELALAAARRRFPGGRVYRRADGSWRYMSRHGVLVGSGLMCHLLVQPAFRSDGVWVVLSSGRPFPVRRF